MCQLNLELTSLFQIQNQKQSNPKLNPKTESPFSVSNPIIQRSRGHVTYAATTVTVAPRSATYIPRGRRVRTSSRRIGIMPEYATRAATSACRSRSLRFSCPDAIIAACMNERSRYVARSPSRPGSIRHHAHALIHMLVDAARDREKWER